MSANKSAILSKELQEEFEVIVSSKGEVKKKRSSKQKEREKKKL
jgi:hypothetical protein